MPLSDAVFFGDGELVEYLLEKGANANALKGKIMFIATGNLFVLNYAGPDYQENSAKYLLEKFDKNFSILEMLLKSGGSLKFTDQSSSRYPVSILHLFVFKICKKRFSSLDYIGYFRRISTASKGRARLLTFDLELFKTWESLPLLGDEQFDIQCLKEARSFFAK